MNWRWDQVERLLEGCDPRLGAEIGVKEGRFISHLLNVFPNLIMYAVDPWEQQPEGNENYSEWDFDEIYKQYQKNTQTVSRRISELRFYSETASKRVGDGTLDFVFIDAQHDYDSVKQDIALWAPKVKKGGLLSGHDYDHKFPGVMKAVDEAVKADVGANSVWYVRV